MRFSVLKWRHLLRPFVLPKHQLNESLVGSTALVESLQTFCHFGERLAEHTTQTITFIFKNACQRPAQAVKQRAPFSADLDRVFYAPNEAQAPVAFTELKGTWARSPLPLASVDIISERARSPSP
jgi:hypothetical protein